MTVVIDRTRSPSPDAPQGAARTSAAARARASGDARGGLYKPRAAIYPKLVHGRWRTIKWAILILTLSIYYVTPWIRWERPGALPDQAVLVDFAGRRFYFFFIQLWPQEVHFLTGLLVLAALGLFLVTALFGRLWCGYSCPQTVWTDLFIHVERLFEGDRNARMRLNAGRWSLNKAWRKLGKHAVWLLIAFSTGGAWIFYFHDAPTLLSSFWRGGGPVTGYVFCLLLTATTYVFAGMMREQVCVYICPWPRIQGAMLDPHSLQVTYRYDRGEPRGAHKKGADWTGRGDCVDCAQCVTACPMGIDIRNGPQLECINCGLCIDACDEIMTRVARPTGLIAYDTDAAVEARANKQSAVYRLLRARTAFYAAAFVLVTALMAWGLTHRDTLTLSVLRDRNPVFVRLHDGAVRNGYTLKIANRAFQSRQAHISLEGPAGARISTPGGRGADRVVTVTLPANEVRAVRVFVTLPPAVLTQSNLPATFVVSSGDDRTARQTNFLSGAVTAP